MIDDRLRRTGVPLPLVRLLPASASSRAAVWSAAGAGAWRRRRLQRHRRIEVGEELGPLAIDVDHKRRDVLAVWPNARFLRQRTFDPLDAVARRMDL